MAPKTNKSSSKESKRNKKVIILASKLKILDLLKNGEKVGHIARRFDVNESTIGSITDNEVNM